MELRTFIKTALTDIVSGVKDAQDSLEDSIIVPGGVSRNLNAVKHGVSELQSVDFEVNVIAEESTGSEGKLGVVSSIIGAGIAGKSEKGETYSSKLKFKVPIQLPTSGHLKS